VNEQIFHSSILGRVYNQIAKADLIVADMTGRNPNAFYEVGYAHALNRNAILLTEGADHIPFDLKHIHTYYIEVVLLTSKRNWKSGYQEPIEDGVFGAAARAGDPCCATRTITTPASRGVFPTRDFLGHRVLDEGCVRLHARRGAVADRVQVEQEGWRLTARRHQALEHQPRRESPTAMM
jgi:hypothetical protein